ncbi:hypothetical protein TWF506_008047 [Arthrobotrys conoides]|uniref:Uncharacterized protein n=1 Tax=Arthrobotrys conoides TaxID=74498 RepID=A0AAN8NKX2_9PEZI
MGFLIWNNSISMVISELPSLTYDTDHLADPFYFLKWLWRIIWIFALYQVILAIIVLIGIKIVDVVKTFLEVNGYIDNEPEEWFGAPSTWRVRRQMIDNKQDLGQGPLLKRVLGEHVD